MRFLLAIVLGAFGTAAFAADMPLKAPRAAPVVVDGWQGLYVGIQGGENLGSYNPLFGVGDVATKVNLDDNAPFVGAHIGYLFGDTIYFGPELGVQYWNFKKKGDLVAGTPEIPPSEELPAIAATPAVQLQQTIDWMVYANVRVGASLIPNTLIYVTGGAAWAHVRGEILNGGTLGALSAFDQGVLGWNVGAGLEFKLGPNLVLGAEYRHMDFGKVSPANPALALIGLAPAALTVDQAMGRLSWRFAPGGGYAQY
jgi:outer membrane immunogenic protein